VIIHCSKKLATKLPVVSSTPLQETSPLGSWHGHLFTLDHRQCVLFCHDASRYCLFHAGIRKTHLADLGGSLFRGLYLETLKAIGVPIAQMRKVELALGPARYDAATSRSVQGTIRVAQQDLYALLARVENVMDLDPLTVSYNLNQRPTTIFGRWLWPDKAMREAVAAL
jgi:hypothetical protein